MASSSYESPLLQNTCNDHRDGARRLAIRAQARHATYHDGARSLHSELEPGQSASTFSSLSLSSVRSICSAASTTRAGHVQAQSRSVSYSRRGATHTGTR